MDDRSFIASTLPKMSCAPAVELDENARALLQLPQDRCARYRRASSSEEIAYRLDVSLSPSPASGEDNPHPVTDLPAGPQLGDGGRVRPPRALRDRESLEVIRVVRRLCTMLGRCLPWLSARPPPRNRTEVCLVLLTEPTTERRLFVPLHEGRHGDREDRRVRDQDRLPQDEGLADDDRCDGQYMGFRT